MNELLVPKRHTLRTEVAALPARLAFDYSQARVSINGIEPR